MLMELLRKPLVAALLILLGTFSLVYWLRGTLMPLLIGAVLAYIFMPVVDRLSRGRSRRIAALLVVAGFLAGVAGLGLWTAPQVSAEIGDASATLYDGLGRLEKYYPRVQRLWPRLPPPSDPQWREHLRDRLLEDGHEYLAPLVSPSASARALSGLGSQLTGLVGLLLEMLFVPIFFYYLLVDGPALIAAAERRIPARAAPIFAKLMETMNASLRAYVRSAAKVVGVLVFAYALIFLGLGMPLALPLALVCAAAHWVPFVGTVFSAALAAGLVLLHYGADWRLAVAPLLIFLIHSAEVAWITPRVVGKGVGLHPLITIVALLLGVRFFGLGGLLLALPAAAAIAGVLPIVLPEHARPAAH